jgi:hypothetical protein
LKKKKSKNFSAVNFFNFWSSKPWFQIRIRNRNAIQPKILDPDLESGSETLPEDRDAHTKKSIERATTKIYVRKEAKNNCMLFYIKKNMLIDA